MLGITKDLTQKVYTNQLPFIKVLAVKKNKIMSNLQSTTPLIIRNGDIPKLNVTAQKLIEVEDKADAIYGQISASPISLPYLYQPTLIINK
jgi:hypothetical protein